MPKVYQAKDGKMFHGECFEEGESKEDFTVVDLNEIDDAEVCGSCGGEFFAGPEDDDDSEEDED